MQAYERTAITTALHFPKVWERFVDDVYSILKRTYIGSLHILTNTYTTALTTKQVARKVLLPPYLIEHIALSQIKMTYTKKMPE